LPLGNHPESLSLSALFLLACIYLSSLFHLSFLSLSSLFLLSFFSLGSLSSVAVIDDTCIRLQRHTHTHQAQEVAGAVNGERGRVKIQKLEPLASLLPCAAAHTHDDIQQEQHMNQQMKQEKREQTMVHLLLLVLALPLCSHFSY